MKNRYMLLLVAMLIGSQLNAINPNNIAQAVKAAHRNFFAFNKTGRVSVKQKYGIIKRAYFDLNGMKYPGSPKQWGIDKLHTQKRFWMTYSAITTALLALVPEKTHLDITCYLYQTLPKEYKNVMSQNHDAPNPYAAAEKAADDAALL